MIGRRRRSPWLRTFAAVVALVFAATAAGMVWFVGHIPRRVVDPTTATDAIVVLTGGADRLATGLDLLAGGLAGKLFISGVYRGVEVKEILRVSRQTPSELQCCIELGHSAVDTAGNARETARWMRREGYRSIRLVTANYHMPRSLIEFRRVMPDITIVANPVFPRDVHVDGWWRWPGSASLVFVEFGKYLVARMRAFIAATPRVMEP